MYTGYQAVPCTPTSILYTLSEVLFASKVAVMHADIAVLEGTKHYSEGSSILSSCT